MLGWREQSRARCREELADRAFETVREKGARIAPDEVIAYALEDKAPVAVTVPAVREMEQVLTKREREVAAMVARGLTNKEIAAERRQGRRHLVGRRI